MHYIKKCKHGIVQSQCRCFDKNKHVEIVSCLTGPVSGELVHPICREK
jgi:hypothetical protein